MTLTQLEYALAIAKYGSFKSAAERRKVSQPALSMQIQKLEDEFDIRIFDRKGSKLKITADGELFLERAQEIVAAMNAAVVHMMPYFMGNDISHSKITFSI